MTTSIYEIWEKGVQLNRSPRAFSPKAEKQEYDRLYSLSAIEAFSNAAEQASKTGLTGLEGFNASISSATTITSARSKWNERMRRFVHHHLLHDNLFGYGFEPPRKIDSQPLEIPKVCWNGQIRWDKNTLASDGLEFVQIRLVSKEARLKLLDLSAQATNVIKSGRPSIREHVKEAFDDLLANDLIDPSVAAKNHFELVRKWLRAHKPEAGYTCTKPSNEGIRAHFSPLFNELKKSKKQ